MGKEFTDEMKGKECYAHSGKSAMPKHTQKRGSDMPMGGPKTMYMDRMSKSTVKRGS